MTAPMDPARWTRLKEIFQQALEHEPNERPAIVAHACGTDAALQEEVERLLNAHDEAGAFLEVPAAAMTGRRIGRYDVGRLLGAGGMGEVYIARDVELGRDVALKLATSIDGEARLRREAQHASRLNHPNICTVHEVGTFEGRVYIAMEYVEGERLSELIPPGGLPVDRVARYGSQIASALAHAHEHGIIHRDLKGANVVVTPDGRAKLLDFGLARHVPTTTLKTLSESRASISGDRGLAGTLACMAPETLRGAEADARSDIWSLGVLLYEMAAGARPFTGTTGFELSAAILHAAPAVPSRVPAPLQDVIRRCLAKRPEDRYQRADDILPALDAIAADDFGGRTPTRGMIAALFSLLIVVIGATVPWRSWNTPEAPAQDRPASRQAIAVLAFENLAEGEDTAWLPKGVQSMLLTGLAQTRGLAIVSTRRLQEVTREIGVADLESLDRVQASDVARRAGAGTAVVGSIVRAGAALRIDAQVEDLSSGRVLTATSVSGTDLFAMVDDLAARIRASVGMPGERGARPVSEVSSASLEAYRLYAEGVDAFANFRLDAAQALLEQAVTIDPEFAEAYLQLAFVSGPAGRAGARSGYLRKAREHMSRLSEPRRLVMEVEVARDEGRYVDAARELDRLVARFPDLDAIATIAGQLYTPLVGPLPDAAKLLAITTRVVAANPSSTLARNSHGYALLYVGRGAEAIQELEAAARLAPREPNPYDSLGDAYLLTGSLQRALEAYARAMTIDPTFSTGGRAWALAILGRFDEALGDPAPPHLTAAILARVGRYRDAMDIIEAAARSAEAGGDLADLAGIRLLSALISIERREYARAVDATRTARVVLARLPSARSRLSLALLELIAGIAEARRGRLAAARGHAEALRQLYPDAPGVWWPHVLDGEIALAGDDAGRASAAFARGEPSSRQFFRMLVEGSVLGNDAAFRDGRARVAVARGDLAGAVAIYRGLLAFGPEQKWVAAFEPRYVLEIARLLERMGDRQAARTEYERFLRLWSRADTELPELAEARQAIVRLGNRTAGAE